jgi:DNA-binding response OmpR family regulator
MAILVVDDDESILDFVVIALSEEGYEIHTARDGREALQVAEKISPELILLDMHMPIMNGWEFAKEYSSGTGPRGKIVVVTAGHNAVGAAQEIGADDYLPKPFAIDQLLELAEKYTGGA